MARFTKQNGLGQWIVNKDAVVSGDMVRGPAIDKLARLEIAEEEKRLIELPVPLGTKVFRLHWVKDKNEFVIIPVSGFSLADYDVWGINVFETPEKAKEEIQRRHTLGKKPGTLRFCPECGSIHIKCWKNQIPGVPEERENYIVMCGHCEATTFQHSSKEEAERAWNRGCLAGHGFAAALWTQFVY